jgi:hypothetical protein
MKLHLAALVALAFAVSGCAFFEEVNRLGADLDVGLGGLLADAVDIRVKASVAIERSGAHETDPAAGGAGGDRGFL